MSAESVPVAPINQDKPRLNILALPTRTTLLFGLIILIVFVPVLAAFGSGAPVCAPFLLVGVILLPLRDFLRRPGVIARQNDLADVGDQFPCLTKTVRQLSTQVAHIQPPRLLVSSRLEDAAYTFGTWRRRYLGLAESSARALERTLSSPDSEPRQSGQSFLLHELAHFVHSDVWMSFFAESLLRVVWVFMTLCLCVFLLTPFIYYALVVTLDFKSIVSPALITTLTGGDVALASAFENAIVVSPARWDSYEVFVFGEYWPLIVGAVLLRTFFWPALLRTRELYADARVVQYQQGDWQSLRDAMALASLLESLAAVPTDWRSRFARWRQRFWKLKLPVVQTLHAGLSFHPSPETRETCLEKPHEVYGNNWAIGLTAGAAVVLLNLILLSLLSSRYIRGPNSEEPFLLGFTVISLSLLPFLCQFEGPRRTLLGKTTRIVLIFSVIKLVPEYLLALLIAWSVWAQPSLIDWVAGALANVVIPPGSLGDLYPLFWENLIIRPTLFFTFVMPLFLIGYLMLDAWLKRKVLRWFGATFVVRHPLATFWGITFVLDLVLAFVILPIFDKLTIPTAHDLLDPWTLIPLILALALSLCAAALFLYYQRRYADRCPCCGGQVHVPYALGIKCPACGQALNTWLLVPSVHEQTRLVQPDKLASDTHPALA